MPSSEPAKRMDVGAEKRDKPWKYDAVFAVTVLEWAVEKSSVSDDLDIYGSQVAWCIGAITDENLSRRK